MVVAALQQTFEQCTIVPCNLQQLFQQCTNACRSSAAENRTKEKTVILGRAKWQSVIARSAATKPITRENGKPLRRRQYLIIQTMDSHLRENDEKNGNDNVGAGLAPALMEKQCTGGVCLPNNKKRIVIPTEVEESALSLLLRRGRGRSETDVSATFDMTK